ncbi:AsmA-like C-terminal region [Ruegeria halocynthiae]|uniref:AsmA-like C-terminal region n=1 Tax=Ruegeria halocynthiae TaxID=985054 RepID=A0A1H3EG71_9RHOB|nr:AsmA family protein [Ruegeria halocynthiae]SDX77726.1 AsmA-like C-terminal region [Ruegeria halocynthiae]
MRYLAKGVLICCAVAVFAVWLLLSSALFSSVRTAFVENLITKKLGQDVIIEDEVRLGLGRQLQVSATGLVLPGLPHADVNLAAIDKLEFAVSARDLWNSKLSLSNLSVSGVHLNLITGKDGVGNWQSSSQTDVEAGKPEKAPKLSVAGILTDHKIDLTDITILYQSDVNGLELDLKVPELHLTRDKEADVATAIGTGSLNGQKFDLNATFPVEDPFQVAVKFEQISIAAKEVPQESGLQVKTTIEIAELGQLLDILKLNRVLEGSGNIGATFKTVDGVARINDLSVLAELDGGQSLALTGQIGELGNAEDVSLTTRIRLYPEDAEPAPAASRYDLKLIAVDMVIDSVPEQIPQRQMVIKTNGFTLDTSGEGPPPIKFSELSRTPEGALRVGSINLRIGNPADPFIILDGSVDDALQLQGISAEGLMDVPASSLISPELLGPDDQLGRFSGDFHLNGDINQLSLTNLDGQTSETDVWNLNVHGTVKNVLKFENLDLAIDVEVPSGADLLDALSLEPVETGQVRFEIGLVSEGADWNATASVEVADSVLKIVADLDDATSDPVLQGSIESDLIKIDQIRTIVQAAAQLRKLGGSEPEEQESKQEDEGDQGALRDVTLKPIGRSILLSGMDMDVDIDLRQIEGAKGISSLQSELTLNKNELKAGPLEFEYGGAHFDVSGQMDLSNDAHLLMLTGKAGGWQLDDILHTLNFKKGASGTIYADFSVTGGTDSPKHFASTMSGNATVSMRDGSIETQLLDLAGLGVLPWVFTKEKQKVAPIVCLRAPISISNGSISTKQTTLETDHVQVVVFGGVNVAGKVLDLNLQPRKIGEPLSKSPWPVTLKGPLTKPKIKVKDGPKRLKRSNGADKMPAKRKLCVPDILQLQ